MTTLDELVPSESKYLTKDEVGEKGRDLKISNFSREELQSGDNKTEVKAVVHFENSKPMVLNVTNKELLKTLFQTNDPKELIGRVVNVYNDPTISFGGRITGGIRIRKPMGDDIPF